MANDVFTILDVDIASEEAIPYCVDQLGSAETVSKDQVRNILKFYRAEVLVRLMRKKINN